MLNHIHFVIGATVVAVLTISSALLVTSYDHDLARTVAIVGFMAGIVVGVAYPIYELLDRRFTDAARTTDRRLARLECAANRVVAVEQDVLVAIRDKTLN